MVLLLSVLVLSLAQIILRNIYDDGIVWMDALLRAHVLWLALIGAMMAVKENRHIAITFLNSYMNESVRSTVRIIKQSVSAIICFTVSYYSFSYMLLEYEYETIAFWKIPLWLTTSIIPITFLVMGLRYITHINDIEEGSSR